MFTEAIDQVHPGHRDTKPFQLLSFFAVLVFALSLHPAKAHAQIIGELEVTVPFQFHAGNAKLPAGKYVLHMLDNSDLRIMEISAPDGSTSALFEVEDADANSAPRKSELIFNKYGDRYFLARVFDEGNPYGSKFPNPSTKRGSAKRRRKPRPTCLHTTRDERGSNNRATGTS